MIRRRIVRVQIGRGIYAYRCPGAKLGDYVLVELPRGRGKRLAEVVGYGRGGYLGRIKSARRVGDVYLVLAAMSRALTKMDDYGSY